MTRYWPILSIYFRVTLLELGHPCGKAKRNKPGGRLNIKMPSYQYRDSHVKDKAVSPTILSLTWESPYLGKMVFILRRSPGACVMGYTVTVSFTKAPFR